MKKSASRAKMSSLPFRTKRGGVTVKPGKWQRLALVNLGKKFPKVRVDVLSSGSRNTSFTISLNEGSKPLVEVYRVDLGQRMTHTQTFNVAGTKIAVFALCMEQAPSDSVEFVVYGVF